MKAVIMAGGFGTRLRPLTLNLPKPMVPMANRPLMEHIINLLKHHKITSILSILHYQPEIIKDYFEDGSRFGVEISYVSAEEDLGTAGSVKNAQKYLDEPFIVISGDVLTDFNLTSAIKFHRTSSAIATIALTRVVDPLPYGIVITDETGRIIRFLEKPTWGEVFSDTINTGIYILDPKVFDFIPTRSNFDFSANLFPLLLKKELPLFGYIAKGYWRDIGNLTEYRLAHYDLLHGKIKLDILGERVKSGSASIWMDKGVSQADNVSFKEGVIIGKRCKIGEGVHLENTVVGDGCVIEKWANISNSILWNKVKIGKGSELKENVVGAGSHIKDGAFLQAGAILSEGCTVGVNSRVRANVKIWPYKVVEDGATLSTSLIWGEKWTRSLFGTHGVVGLANVEISPEFASRLGAAYGASFPQGSLVMTSRSNDKTCRMINRAIMTGTLSVGVNVGDLRTIPVPVARHHIRTSGASGGLHIRRAPRDPQSLEIQFFDENGLDILGRKEKAIEQLFLREDFRRATAEDTGELSFPYRVIEYYREAFLDNIDTELIAKRNFRLVIDYGFGEAVSVFPSILGELKCEVVALNAHPNPSEVTKSQEKVEKSLKQLSNIVTTLHADLGFLLDPEAEMTFFVDERGKIISNDLALAIVTWLVGKIYPGETIAVPATASRIIEDIAPKVKRIKTTSRAMMDEKEAYLVGNARGGFIFPRFQPAFDAMFAVVKILELLARAKTSLAKIASYIPPFYLLHERVPCPWEAKGKIMRHLTEMTTHERRELIDGVKIYHDRDWVFLLPSTNRALFHVFSEAGSIKNAKALSKRFTREIKRLARGA